MKKPRYSGLRLCAALAILVTAAAVAERSRRLAGRPAIQPEVATAATRDTSRQKDGRHLLEEFTRPGSPLVLSEVGSAHPAVIFDETGDASDWLEVTNVSRRPVPLGDWQLGLGPRLGDTRPLPDLTLPAGESLVLWLSGKHRMSSVLARPCDLALHESHTGEVRLAAPAGKRPEYHLRPPPPRAACVEIEVPEALDATLWLKLRTRDRGPTVLEVSVDGQAAQSLTLDGADTHVVRVPSTHENGSHALAPGLHEVLVRCAAGGAELRYVSFVHVEHGNGPTYLHAHLADTVVPGDILQLLNPRNDIMDRVVVPAPSPGLTWQVTDRGWGRREFAPPTPAGALFAEPPLLQDMPFFSPEPLVVKTAPLAEGLTLHFTRDGRVPTSQDQVLIPSRLSLRRPTLLRVRGFLGDRPATAVVTRHFWIGELPELPVVMVGLDRSQLEGNNLGLDTNSALRSPEWERVAYVRMFEGNDVWMDGPVGLRLHAGIGISAGNWTPFRLYPRARLGPDRMRVHPFDPEAPPPRQILVDPTYGWLRDHLAYSMVNAVGGLAPRTRPALVFFNGSYHGIGTLVERIDDDFLTERLGHTDFDVVKGKPWEVKKGDTDRFDALARDVTVLADRTMAGLADRIDFESLTRLHSTSLLTGAVDELTRAGESWQGYMAMDRSVDPGRLHFLAWDLDGSFQSPDLNPIPVLDRTMLDRSWRQRFLGPRLVHELLRGDPEYRSYYLRMVESTWNFTLASEHWHPIVDRLEAHAKVWSRHQRPLYTPDPRESPMKKEGSWTRQFHTIRRFLDERSAMMFQALADHLGVACHPVTVRVPSNHSVLVDGHDIQGNWQGTWFEGGILHVSVPEAEREFFQGFLVNGREVTTPDVELPVTGDLRLEVRFANP